MGERVITGEISLIGVATPPTVKVRSVGPLMVPCPIIIESYLPCAPAPLPSLISAASLVLSSLPPLARSAASSKFHRPRSFVWHLILVVDDERRKTTTFGRQRLTDNGSYAADVAATVGPRAHLPCGGLRLSEIRPDI